MGTHTRPDGVHQPESEQGSGGKQQSKLEDPPTFEEAFVYKLGPILGGFQNIMEMDGLSVLKHMQMVMEKEVADAEAEAEKEQQRIWLNYLSLIFSQQPQGEEPPQRKQARNEFTKAIKPGEKREQLPSNQSTSKETAKIYDWDFERLKKFQQQQKGG